ncbi:MAG TPA: double zinc ribbon domain-containing protein [Gammaproteobacteria bacterium]
MPKLLDSLSFRFLPGCCLLCQKRSGRHHDLCSDCEHDLPWLGVACTQCALPVPATHRGACGDCLKLPPVQDASRAVFRYGWPLDSLIQRFKFNGDHAAGRTLGELFAQGVRARTPLPDCLLPVPLHSRRLRERGFNQSELLADSVATKLAMDVRNDLVERIRETAVQSGMNAVARRRNVRNAFALCAERLPAHIAILDDVVTTGSTSAEIARLLRRAGVKRIEVWALARAV